MGRLGGKKKPRQRDTHKMCSHETGATLDSLEITRAFKLISLSHLASVENVGFCEKTGSNVFYSETNEHFYTLWFIQFYSINGMSTTFQEGI